MDEKDEIMTPDTGGQENDINVPAEEEAAESHEAEAAAAETIEAAAAEEPVPAEETVTAEAAPEEPDAEMPADAETAAVPDETAPTEELCEPEHHVSSMTDVDIPIVEEHKQESKAPEPAAEKVAVNVKPVYDAFMYEPIGFDGYDRKRAARLREEDAEDERRQRIKRERFIVAAFILLVLVTIALSVYGIAADIMRSDLALKDLASGRNVVLYREKKPAGSNDLDNFRDENGKYTTEGVAAAVKPSIVEIYTYEDELRNHPTGTGSGVIISKDGYIVTNAHVLLEKGYHDVHMINGDVYNAKVVGRDAKTDIAVIKISGNDFEPAVLGDSNETIVGEQVVAVGNPAGLSSTVTDGIVSAVNRKIRSDATGFEMDCIQTNAAISPGNSGGALVNMYGQVIGITSSKYVSSTYEGLGFAITINEASPIIQELINNGFVSGRFRIGISLKDMASESKRKSIEEDLGFELPEDFEGIYISSISEDCDIAKTALKPGDFITAINGTSIKTYDELYETISASYSANDLVPATCAHVDKNGKVKTYEIKFRLMEDTSGNY